MIIELIRNLFKNPETKKKIKVPKGYRGFIEIDENVCIKCGLCTRVCPTGALKKENGKIVYYPELCTFCGLCVTFCPKKAIKQTEKYERIEKRFVKEKEVEEKVFMSGFEYEKRRIKYRDPWILFSFLFIIFEEFIVLMSFFEPISLEALVFLTLISSSILVIAR